MGRSAGVRPRCSLNNGKNRTGKWLEVQAKSLTNRLVPVLWACQWLLLNEEVSRLDKLLAKMVDAVAPQLTAKVGIGAEVASALLVAVGDNQERLRNEASFAALCGVSPVDASSGRQHRHRLNRGGNRDANRALWVIAFVRMRCDTRTKEYTERRKQEGLSSLEITRCLKRYIARELFKILHPLAISQQAGSALKKAA
jgi:transposase